MRVVEDIVTMLNRVCQRWSREDAVLVTASAYRSYAHHHRGRYWAFTRMSPGGRTRNSCGVSSEVARQPASARRCAWRVQRLLSSSGLRDGWRAADERCCRFWPARPAAGIV